MASRANIYIGQNTTFSTGINVRDDNNIPFNITNYTFLSDARKVFSSSKIFSFTTTKIANTVGQLDLSLSANTTLGLNPGKYQYDVIMINNLNERTIVLEGLVFILDTMTRG